MQESLPKAGQSQLDAWGGGVWYRQPIGKPCLCLDKTALGGEWLRGRLAVTVGAGVGMGRPPGA